MKIVHVLQLCTLFSLILMIVIKLSFAQDLSTPVEEELFEMIEYDVNGPCLSSNIGEPLFPDDDSGNKIGTGLSNTFTFSGMNNIDEVFVTRTVNTSKQSSSCSSESSKGIGAIMPPVNILNWYLNLNKPKQEGSALMKIKFTCGGDNTTFVENFNNSLKNIENGILTEEDFGCFPKNILKAIHQKQGTTVLNVCLKLNLAGASATYSPSDKTIGFISTNISDVTNIHELIHYYQDLSAHYPNMIQMASGNKGFANIEFETRLLLDIMKGYPDEFISELRKGGLLTKEELYNAGETYNTFIQSFRDTNKNLLNPNTLDKSNFNIQYKKFLTFYATKSKNYQSDFYSDMEPKALYELLNFVFNNCNH